MYTKKIIGYGFLAVIVTLAFTTLSLTGCPPGPSIPTLSSITAVYTQGSTIVYPTTPLNDLKAGLTVTAAYSNDATQPVTSYALSGTLTVGTSTVTVTYEGKETTFTVTVTAAATTAPTITTTSLPGGTVGTAYSQTLTATGDTPITWNIESGALPTGLSLSGNTISGNPTTVGTSNFTVKATNAVGSTAKPLSIAITSGGGDPDVQFFFQAGPENVTRSYSGPTASWITTPYSQWSWDNGKLTVNWDAAEGAGYGVSYDVVISEEGKGNFFVIVSSPNFWSNFNLDRMVAEIATHDYPDFDTNNAGKSVISFKAKWPGTWKIGVIAKSERVDTIDSDVVWANDGATQSFSDASFVQP